MNQFYYESRAKEKIRELQVEGLRSQAYHRSGAPRTGLFHGLQKFIKAILRGGNARNAKSVQGLYARPASEK